jgi:arylsulfatase A-like enzyme
MTRRLLTALFLLLTLPTSLFAAEARQHEQRPKLILILVIDQFRGDLIERYHSELKGRGFNLFYKEGAWFTDCYYDYANTKTAPGHATIGTGAYTDGHGIDSNEWWDAARSDGHKVSSVEDERYQLVDIPASSIPANQPGAPSSALHYVIGASPRNLHATTIGDELRLATIGRSRVYGISLKDRASILPAGQSANAAYWIDQISGHFTTSTYYMEHLPKWAADFNNGEALLKAERAAQAEGTSQFYEIVGLTPAANEYELDFARALITGEKLGQGNDPDLLTLSLSPNDIMGHQFGPDSDNQHDMVISMDQQLDQFFAWIDKTIGLNNVWIAFTADHGIAPIPHEAAELGIHASYLDLNKLYAALNASLNARFSPGKKTNYLMPPPELPYIVLNHKEFEAVKVDEKTAEDALATLLPSAVAAQAPKISEGGTSNEASLPLQHRVMQPPTIVGIYTRQQLSRGELPPSEWGRLLAHSVADHGNWYDMLVLEGYQMEDVRAWGGTTHFSPWSYDRHVPLGLYGAPFVPGEYHGRVAPVDIAATFASLAGVNQPSAAVGRVLTEALRSDQKTTAQKSDGK